MLDVIILSVTVPNTLAHYNNELITTAKVTRFTTVKSFIDPRFRLKKSPLKKRFKRFKRIFNTSYVRT
jgi:hypothetical protein